VGKAEKEQAKRRQKLEALAPEKIKEEQAIKVGSFIHLCVCMCLYVFVYLFVYICVGMGEGEIGGGGSERPFCPGAPEKN
jgi:hypothetical protein